MEHDVIGTGIHAAARATEVAGVVIMLVGALLATGAFAVRWAGQRKLSKAYHELRADLGRAILLGLELLVIADIIGTVAMEPTFRSLGVLGLIVAIRTFLSWSLELEVSGRWPWARGSTPMDTEAKGAAPAPPPG